MGRRLNVDYSIQREDSWIFAIGKGFLIWIHARLWEEEQVEVVDDSSKEEDQSKEKSAKLILS